MKVETIRILAIFGALAIFWLLILAGLIAFCLTWRKRRAEVQVATPGHAADPAPASTPSSTAERVRIRIDPLIHPEAKITTTVYQQKDALPAASGGSASPNPLIPRRRQAITWTGGPPGHANQTSRNHLEVSSDNRSLRDCSPLTEWRLGDRSESPGREPRFEMTLVLVASSSQLIIYLHRLINLPLRNGKQYATYVKISLCSQSKRTLRSSVAPKSLNPSYDQVFTFSDVTVDVVNASTLRVDVKTRQSLTGAVSLGVWSRSLGQLQLNDGQPRAFSAAIKISGDTDSEASLAQRHSIAELGQMLISLQYQNEASRLKVFIRKAQVPSTLGSSGGLKPFEAEYVVVVNVSVRHGTAEVKQTKAARGQRPIFNQAFLFDVPPDQMDLCWVQLTLVKRTFGRHQTAVGHVTLGVQSTPEGEQHWRAAINPREFEVTQWHRLTRR